MVPVLPPATEGMLAVQVVSNNYFASMGLAFPAGGSFEAVAPREACRVGVLNEEAAQLYFGGNAVGGAVIDRNGRRTRIVGVVRDARLRSTQQQAEPSIYVPMEQNVLPRMHVMLGSVDANDDLVAAVRRNVSPLWTAAGRRRWRSSRWKTGCDRPPWRPNGLPACCWPRRR